MDNERLNMIDVEDESMDDELTEDCVFLRDKNGEIVRLEVPDDVADD